MTAQFDFRPAYDNLLYAYLPRWGGSYDLIAEFGLECAATKRFDTDVPKVLADALEKIRGDSRDWTIFAQPAVLTPLVDVYNGEITHAASDDDKRFQATQLVGIAWQIRRWDIGRAALDRIDGKWSIKGMNFTGVVAERAISGTFALTGKHANQVKAAEKRAASGDVPGAADAYVALASAANVDPRETTWLRGRAQELRWQEQFDRGEWVDLMPNEQLDGWSTEAGTFSSTGKELAGTIDGDRGSMLVCGLKLGNRWEFKGHFAIPKPAANDQIGLRADAGIFFAMEGFNRYDAVFGRPWQKEVHYLYHAGDQDRWVSRTIAPEFPIEVEVFDGLDSLSIDSQSLFKADHLYELGDNPSQQIAIGGTAAGGGVQFRVDELKVHKLSETPFK